MIAVGLLVWRLLQWQERREKQQSEKLDDHDG
jgi:hypothetical protein